MRKYEYDANVFKNINTESEAYWLGFLLADGHNYQDKKIRIDIKDEGHLEHLSELIYPNGDKPIKNRDLGYGPVYYFDCSVGVVVENLCSHGIVPNKSKITTLPIIPNNMYKHFIRGLFDGDGSLSYSMDKNYRRYTFSIVGTHDLMMGVKNVIYEQIGITLGFGKMKNIYRVYKRGNQRIFSLLFWLYENSEVYLQRKFDKYQDMLNHYKQKNR